MNWRRSSIAPDGSHHHVDGRPMYPQRFVRVQKFHEPGLAPVTDTSGAFHIRPDGSPAYPQRFQQTWGFYEGRAAVRDVAGWFHILPDGSAVTTERHDWCGNFQEGRCPVRTFDGHYLHVDESGMPAYAGRYLYAGDFRDGAAVVRCPSRGLCTHIGPDGRVLHDQWFIDLDVFHKGVARARDSDGWFHVDRQGSAIHSWRYAEIEPFYNGQARVLTYDGRFVVIDEQGGELAQVGAVARDEFMRLSGDIVGSWSTDIIAAAVELGVFDVLPADVTLLASACGLRADCASRLLRALHELGLVHPVGASDWRLTERGRFLQRSHPLQLADAAIEFGRELKPKWARLISALRSPHWRPGDIFEEVAAQGPRRDSLQRMQRTYAAHDYAGVAALLPFASARHIVDAGGGTGFLTGELKRAFPTARVTLLERPEVCEVARAGCAATGVEVIAGDIFAPWPVRVDGVILARILHDWDDEDAVRLLSRARAALADGGTLVILDMALSESRPAGGMCDLHLMVVTGGRERTVEQFRVLLSRAGFRLISVYPTRSVVSVLVAEPS